MTKFKVGDEVRVKAGSGSQVGGHKDPNRRFLSPYHTTFGVKLEIVELPSVNGKSMYNATVKHERDLSLEFISVDNLEHWNPAEEWDGSKWVAKKQEGEAKPAIVMRRGEFAYRACESTNEAFRLAEELSRLPHHAGMEFVVYQEKGSRKVEKKSKAEELAEWLRSVSDRLHLNSHPCHVKSVLVCGDDLTVVYKVQP